MPDRLPPDEPIIANPWLRWGVIFAIYTGLALFFFGQVMVSNHLRDGDLLWWRELFDEAIYWYLWAAMTPLILRFARRYRIERAAWQRGVLAHVLLALVLAPLHDVLWRILVAWWLYDLPLAETGAWLQRISGRVAVGTFTGFYKYWLIVALYYTFDYYHKYRRREQEAARLAVDAAQLKAQLRQAELDALKMQLHPHFLFNTLNTISVLMNEDVEKANQVLLRLGELLRVTLDQQGAQTVPLRQERDFLRRYLGIEEIRFADRLQVVVDIPPDLLDAAVPTLILQPLVENALRHGLAPQAAAGTLTLRARRDGDDLVLTVADDGVGLQGRDPSALPQAGIGLANTQARLQQRYGDAHRFTLAEHPDGGTEATVVFPYEPHPDAR